MLLEICQVQNETLILAAEMGCANEVVALLAKGADIEAQSHKVHRINHQKFNVARKNEVVTNIISI